MRAIVCTDYGPPDVLQLRDVRKPVPKDNEVLVRIRATTVNAADCELRRFDFAPWIWVPMRLAFGIRRPRQPVLGQELSGDVDSVGKDVTSLRKGDRVFATTGIGLGAYAEYICLRENPKTGAITTMPANLSYEEAAAVPYGGSEALQFLRKAHVQSGQRVLVNGAGGSFGTFAVQLAKDLGAHVTAVDIRGEYGVCRQRGTEATVWRRLCADTPMGRIAGGDAAHQMCCLVMLPGVSARPRSPCACRTRRLPCARRRSARRACRCRRTGPRR